MTYNKNNPFHAKLKERYLLNQKGSSKTTYHLTLDLSGSDISYKVGDAFAIFPENHPQDVQAILDLFKKNDDESVREFLTKKANLSRITLPLLQLIATYETDPVISALLQKENKQERLSFIDAHDPTTLARHYCLKDVPAETIFTVFAPMLPRLYSVASSLVINKNEVDLVISHFAYEKNGQIKRGIGSEFLCKLADIETTVVPLYLQPTPHFTLPSDPKAPLIMIGPGTGLAPFRGFIQERLHHNHSGKNWLFFGERNIEHDFFYRDYFLPLEKQGALKLSLAFSRDQDEKVYVQHKMQEHAKELWQWIEQGALIYICGDAKKMSKAVTTSLITLIEREGKMSPDQAKAHLKILRKEKRLLLDVY